jgi:hypothetical protein
MVKLFVNFSLRAFFIYIYYNFELKIRINTIFIQDTELLMYLVYGAEGLVYVNIGRRHQYTHCWASGRDNTDTEA